MTPTDIKRIRKNADASVSEFAAMLGLSGENAADTVRKLESGVRAASGPVVVVLRQIEKESDPLLRTHEWTSENLKAARTKLGWRQDELAAALGFTRQHIGLLENGVKPLMPATILAVKYLLLNQRRTQQIA